MGHLWHQASRIRTLLFSLKSDVLIVEAGNFCTIISVFIRSYAIFFVLILIPSVQQNQPDDFQYLDNESSVTSGKTNEKIGFQSETGRVDNG